LSDINGYLIYTEENASKALSFPGLNESRLMYHDESSQRWWWEAMSKPSRTGLIAYAVPVTKESSLISIRVMNMRNNSYDVLLERPLNQYRYESTTKWGHIIPRRNVQLSLSSNGNYWATIVNMESCCSNPWIFSKGTLELWIIREKTKIAEFPALNTNIAWAENSQYIFYTKILSQNEAQSLYSMLPINTMIEWSRNFFVPEWKDVPAIYSYNIQTMEHDFIGFGLVSDISPSGKFLLVEGPRLTDKPYLINLATLVGQKAAFGGVNWKGRRTALTLISDRAVIYEGRPIKHVGSGNFMADPDTYHSLRVGDIFTGKSMPIVKYHNFGLWSFGIVDGERE
jgi:hypothetical protein